MSSANNKGRMSRRKKMEPWYYVGPIFLLLVITIGFVSGFLVADGSMIKAYTEGIDNYNTENGHFRTSEKMNDAQIQSVEENGIRIYNNFYLEQDLTNGSTMRIFANREQVNLACLMEGEFPKAANEIVIDRMYADNNKISIGDTLKSDTQSWKVTGFIALPDYSCLFQNNNDSMFDSVKFGIGVVTSEAFESLDSPLVKYCYAWKYNDEPTTEKDDRISLYCNCDHGICFWHYNQQHHCKRGKCHRNSSCQRLHQK